MAFHFQTAFRLQAVFQPFKWLGHRFTRNISPSERLCHPFIGNINPFKQLSYPSLETSNVSNDLVTHLLKTMSSGHLNDLVARSLKTSGCLNFEFSVE